MNRSVLTLGRAHCSLCRLYLFSFFGGKIGPSGWLSTEVIAFKILVLSIQKIFNGNGKGIKAALVAMI